MDGSELESSTQPQTLEEHLDALCEYYMSIGVSYDEFWYGDYCRLKYYESQYIAQRKIHNEEMWMQGAYIYNAISVALSNAFRGKGKTPDKYLEKPFEFFGKTEREKRLEEERTRQKIIANLNRIASEWKKQDERRHSETEYRDNG